MESQTTSYSFVASGKGSAFSMTLAFSPSAWRERRSSIWVAVQVLMEGRWSHSSKGSLSWSGGRCPRSCQWQQCHRDERPGGEILQWSLVSAPALTRIALAMEDPSFSRTQSFSVTGLDILPLAYTRPAGSSLVLIMIPSNLSSGIVSPFMPTSMNLTIAG